MTDENELLQQAISRRKSQMRGMTLTEVSSKSFTDFDKVVRDEIFEKMGYVPKINPDDAEKIKVSIPSDGQLPIVTVHGENICPVHSNPPLLMMKTNMQAGRQEIICRLCATEAYG